MMYHIFWRVLYVGWQVIKTYIVVIMVTFCLDIVLLVDRRCLSYRKPRFSNEFAISLVLIRNMRSTVDPRSLKFGYVRYISYIAKQMSKWPEKYRAFHNVLRDYKNLLQENRRTRIYETCTDRRNNKKKFFPIMLFFIVIHIFAVMQRVCM
jgi:hypothetical protein